MSMFASITSAISYMGIPGTAYSENIALFLVGFLSLLVAPCLIFVFYPFYRVLHVTTSYEYVLQRYGQRARMTVSGLFVLARLGWLGTVIYAPALALSLVTGVPLWSAILLMGILATAYTALGGLSAVLWTDLVQFLVLVGGALWVALHVTASIPGGMASIWEIAESTDHLRVADWRFSLTEMTGVAVAVSYFFQLMHDYGADQVTVQRLLSVKSLRAMAKATIFNALADLFIVSLLLYVGLGLFAYFQTFPAELAAGIAGDQVLPYYIMHALPQGISGFVITAIFAAAMSSMDSGINSVATVLINDFIRPLRAVARSEQHDVKLARLLTLWLGAFATAVAFYVSGVGQILKASSAFLGLFGGPVLAIFLLGMFTRRASFRGWLIGMLVAVPTTLWVQQGTNVHFIYYFPFCFGLCAGVGYVASLLLGTAGGGPLARPQLTIWGRPRLSETLLLPDSATSPPEIDRQATRDQRQTGERLKRLGNESIGNQPKGSDGEEKRRQGIAPHAIGPFPLGPLDAKNHHSQHRKAIEDPGGEHRKRKQADIGATQRENRRPDALQQNRKSRGPETRMHLGELAEEQPVPSLREVDARGR